MESENKVDVEQAPYVALAIRPTRDTSLESLHKDALKVFNVKKRDVNRFSNNKVYCVCRIGRTLGVKDFCKLEDIEKEETVQSDHVEWYKKFLESQLVEPYYKPPPVKVVCCILAQCLFGVLHLCRMKIRQRMIPTKGAKKRRQRKQALSDFMNCWM